MLYFTELCKTDPTVQHDVILAELQKLSTKIYLEFMSYSLNLLNEFNTFFQAEAPLLHVLQSKTQELVETVSLNYFRSEYVHSFPNVLDINPSPPEEEFLPDYEIYLGRFFFSKLYTIASKFAF